MVHALRSFVWYVGNQKLESNWIPMYILKPINGTLIGLVFYIVIRGGFYSPENMNQETNLYVFVALSSIVGMFTEQAIEKLKIIAEAILTEPAKGRDTEEEEADDEGQDQGSGGGRVGCEDENDSVDPVSVNQNGS